MLRKKLTYLALTALFTAPAAYAGVDLIAIGSISSTYQDLALETAAPLENGVPGNSLGGLGSGLAYAGGNNFLALPDRGPNAVPYNSAVDDTTSYIPRFHSLRMSLAPSAPGSALPFTLTPFLTHTTLLSSGSALYYAPGGAPALNNSKNNYFSGRSDNFDPSARKNSGNPANARLDTESIRVSADGKSVFISDEYGPYVYMFNRTNGRRQQSYALPAKFAVSKQYSTGASEISGNTAGRVANKGMEGLAITPDGSTLFGIMQSPLIQDGGTDAPITRIVKIDVSSGNVLAEYAYAIENIGSVSKPKYGTASDILAINDHEFLVDERDGKGLGDNSTAVVKKVYHIDITGATDVSAITGAANLAAGGVVKVTKSPFLDIVTTLNAAGIASTDIPAKLEGLAFGPDVVMNSVTRHTLYVANDNDFIAKVTDTNHPSGIDNANKFFVFAFDTSDLPNFTAQQIDDPDVPLACH